MKAAIFCGSRDLDYTAEIVVARIMDHYLRDGERHIVIQGDARGADSLFRDAARGRTEVRSFPAQWNRQPNGSYDRRAGFKRNQLMLDQLLGLKDQGYEPYVVALVQDQMTKGTASMVDLATKAGVPVSIFSLRRGVIRTR